MKVQQIFISIVVITSLISSSAEAEILFHATKKQLAKRIASRGFSSAKMKSTARFGKGMYVSTSRKTALAEKPGADAIMRFRHSKYLDRNRLNLYRPSTQKLKELCPNTSLRGKVKNHVIGPKLGKRLGRMASRMDKTIVYRSARQPNGKNLNLFIPRQVYERHPRIIRPVK